MVAGCGNKCVKYFFIFINFLFFALGGVICGLALWVRFDNNIKQRLGSVLNTNLDNLPIENLYVVLYIIAALALVMFFLGFFGCCGSCCESLCVIGIYFIVVLVLFGVEIAGIILIAVNKDNIRNSFQQLWATQLVANYNTNYQIRDMLDAIQRSLNCCGAYSCNDYAQYGLGTPSSCTNCYNAATQYQGCPTVLYNTVFSNMTIVLIIAIAVLVIEFIALIMTCIICKAVKDKRSGY